MALLLSLLVVTLLAATVFPFLYDGRVERAVASNLYTGLQASRLATSGVVIAEALLKLDKQQEQGQAVDSYDDVWAKFNDVPVAAAGGSIAMRITDESGKINLNHLVRGAGQGQQQAGEMDEQWQSILRRLLVVLEQDERTADAMLETLADWIDADERPHGLNGAEKPHYLGLTPPYEPADAPLQSVSELRAVKGWEDAKLVARFSGFVTTQGARRVNVNTAPREVLIAFGLDPAQADAVLEARATRAFRTAQEFQEAVPGRGTQNLSWGGVTSQYFSVTATATFRDSVAVVRALLAREGSRIRRLSWRAE